MSSFIFKGFLICISLLALATLLSGGLGDPSMINPLHVIATGGLVVFGLIATIMAVTKNMGEIYVLVGGLCTAVALAAFGFLATHVQKFGDIFSRVIKS